MQKIKHIFLRIIIDHGDFFGDDAFFLFKVFFGNKRVAYDISQYVRRFFQIAVADLGIVGCVQLAGSSVHMAPDGIHLLCQFPGAAPVRTLESHVLH